MAEISTMRIADQGARALPRKLAFTAERLRDIHCPPGKVCIWTYDTKSPLALMVSAHGARVWYVYRKINGKPERIRLGNATELSIEQARRLASNAVLEIANGANPQAEKRRIRAGGTLQEVFDDYVAKKRLRPRTLLTDQNRIDCCLAAWKGRKLTTISDTDVRAMHAEIGEKHGRVSANRSIQLLRRLFYNARLEPNPCRKGCVDFYKEESRERFVTAAEMPKLFAAIDAEEPLFADFFRVALFTGQRRSNVESMRWDELDLNAARWSIPGSKFKTGKSIDVHLAKPAVAILKRRLGEQVEARTTAILTGQMSAEAPANPWIFPTRSASGHLVEIKSAWKRIRERAGLPDVRPHDLRRSLGSWAAATGASLPLIGKALGHADQSTTQIYARLQLDPVKAIVDTAVNAMLTTGKKTRKAR